MGFLRRILKTYKWWNSEPPLMLAFVYYELSRARPHARFGHDVAMLALFMVATIGIAGFGHVLNDICDVVPDRVRGAHNVAAGRSRAQTAVLMAGVLAAAAIPWLFVPVDPAIVALLVVEFALFAAYSLPPIRLKTRGAAGAIADGLYAYTVPVLVSMLVFARLGHASAPIALLILVGAWTLVTGVRRVLVHQLEVVGRDERVGDRTVATRRGWLSTYRLLTDRLAPAETALCVAVLLALGLHAPLVPVGFVAFAGWVEFRRRRRGSLVLPSRLQGLDRLMVLNVELLSHFEIQWLPLLTLVTLALRDPLFLIVLVFQLAFFENGPQMLTRYDLPELRRLARNAA
jgi:hypothetical protein